MRASPPTLHSSEYKREYKYGLGNFSARAVKPVKFGAIDKSINFPGLRSEEMITVGQYTPVLRTYS